ncbi:MAG: hypothetical protein R6U11_01765 [Bacteroidales bacterium]
MKIKKLITFIGIIFFSLSLSASNLKITSPPEMININTVAETVDIQFSVSWENSWRNDIAGTGYEEPYNHDAIWVFMKYQDSDELWHHVTLRAAGHVMPTGADHIVPTDKKGAFIFRDENGFGNINLEEVILRWDYGFDGIVDLHEINMRIFAIEMVYVPEGAFYVGNEGLTGDVRGQFYQIVADPSDYSNPYQIGSENAITLGGITEGNLGARDAGLDIADGFSSTEVLILPQEYPKGYDAFYCMKYPVTQKQYVDFLNTLTRRQQKNRTYISTADNVYAMTSTSVVFADPGNDSPGESYRNGIRFNPDNFGTNLDSDPPLYFFCDLNENGVGNEDDDGQDISCNFLSGESNNVSTDLAAYLDWAALRPITELEFEKAARGAGQVAGLDIWAGGGDYVSTTNRLVPSDETDYLNGLDDYILNRNYETETVANSNHNCAFGLSGRKYGPTRSGIFARSATNRLESGASYYGIMELSGSLWERTVSVSIVEGTDVTIPNYSYTGIHGDGVLNVNGYADVANWPAILGARGGGFGFNQRHIRISDRAYTNSSWTSRAGPIRGTRSHGGRGVRTAP